MPLAMLEGPAGILLLLFVAVLLFGHRLPNIARSLGSSVSEFKKGVREAEQEPSTPAAPQPAQPPAVNQTAAPVSQPVAPKQ